MTPPFDFSEKTTGYDLSSPDEIRHFLDVLFRTAIKAADPVFCLPPHLPIPPVNGKIIVIGAGKAAAAMASALEQHWGDQTDLSGVVVTRYGHEVPTRKIRVMSASHPVPDDAGLTATREICNAVQNLSADDLVICLISGGGSALLVNPIAPITLDDKQALNRDLLKSGASISEMNCVRRHISQVKGGKLAALCHPATVMMYAISDVPGDNFLDIASGPATADPTTCNDALAILQHYNINAAPSVLSVLRSGGGETIKPGDARLHNVTCHMVATPQMALEAAAKICADQGITAHILGDSIEGEARDVARVMAGMARQIQKYGQPFQAPCILLSGGETTVTIRGKGRGGRNVEFLMALANTLNGQPGIYAIAGDTDGIDGIEEIAGAMITPDTIARARQKNINIKDQLADNNGHGFFETLGDQIITGPTLTNVNDFRAILVTDPTTL
ncbi:glycerate kinase [Thalassospira sp. MCCC 1A01428]|uniref:glycerate kinase type-2 family protein n=1 Tax=Thalassospira sp. MCCC 1A01428 TaxID=1470575 RepID=UPI000A1F0F4B|nr:glycerate kinase [Thalassospira sp. MCCC 1A01428]